MGVKRKVVKGRGCKCIMDEPPSLPIRTTLPLSGQKALVPQALSGSTLPMTSSTGAAAAGGLSSDESMPGPSGAVGAGSAGASASRSFNNQLKFNTDWDDSGDEDEREETEKTVDEKKRLFTKELRLTLFGYGDDQNPYQETVDFLEDLVMEFITSMTQRAMEIGRPGKVQVEDIIFLVRKQPRMYARVRELLTMNEELKKARKAFDEVKYVQGSK